MDHRAHVRFIHANSESSRRNHQVDLVGFPLTKETSSLGPTRIAMKTPDAPKAIFSKASVKVLCLFLLRHVKDSRPWQMPEQFDRSVVTLIRIAKLSSVVPNLW